MRRSVEKLIMDALEQQSPDLAQQVTQFLFGFEDVLRLDGRNLQRILRDVEPDTLRLAMKGLDEERQQIIYGNISERAGARLKEDLENTGATRLRDVEAAQQAIVAVARALQESGEITLRAAEAPAEEDGEEYV